MRKPIAYSMDIRILPLFSVDILSAHDFLSVVKSSSSHDFLFVNVLNLIYRQFVAYQSLMETKHCKVEQFINAMDSRLISH